MPVLRDVHAVGFAHSDSRLRELVNDLHDGPLQSMVALGAEVELFRQQLADVLRDHELREHLVGRAGDVMARIAAVDDELRDVAISAWRGAPEIALATALEREVEKITRETSISATLKTAGQLGRLLRHERVTAFRFVQSALANVRQHSSATTVSVGISCVGRHMQATVSDDGCGFDVEDALVRAAAAGRLGLVGMAERARQSGGSLEVESRYGGPTTLTLTLPVVAPAVGPEIRVRAATRDGAD